ncbi:MAG TPA: hypothetical protein VF543_04150 [Pyrinomonadaceae bacterium]|jgi:hypothetical protein
MIERGQAFCFACPLSFSASGERWLYLPGIKSGFIRAGVVSLSEGEAGFALGMRRLDGHVI